MWYLIQLLALPFTLYKQFLIHPYVLQRPPTSSYAPPRTISIVQDIVCVRLIQACEYAAAIRIDQQIPSTTGGDPCVIERKEMVEDVLAVMPCTERMIAGNEWS
jgi:hypothetical protein